VLSSRDVPLGATDTATWDSHVDRIEPGETLIIVSDGLLDAFADAGEALRAARKLVATTTSADEMADRILAAASAAPLADDITAVVVRRASA
jgi:serine phosphatase RsbU (regulator of sigma subunit)